MVFPGTKYEFRLPKLDKYLGVILARIAIVVSESRFRFPAHRKRHSTPRYN